MTHHLPPFYILNYRSTGHCNLGISFRAEYAPFETCFDLSDNDIDQGKLQSSLSTAINCQKKALRGG